MNPAKGYEMTLPEVSISDIDEDGRWVTLRVKVLQLWEPNSESIEQVGLLGDPGGKIKFVSWKKADLPPLHEGKSYLLKAAVVDLWNHRFQINLNSRTVVTELEEDVEVSPEYVDVITGIIPGSGYVETCSQCSRVLVNHGCPVHTDAEPRGDIIVKATLEDNQKTLEVRGESVEGLVGMSREELKAVEEEDIIHLLYGILVGKRYRFRATECEDSLLVETIREVG